MSFDTNTILIILGILALSGFKVIKKFERAVIISFLRGLVGTRDPGIIYVIPFMERFIRVDLDKNLPHWQQLSKDDLNQKVQELVSKTPETKN